MKKILLTKFLFLVFATAALQAQTRTISGTVTTADDGTPLPGVSIVVKGSTVGSTTDADGKFSLSVSESDVLVLSFIGYRTKEVPVASQSTLEITMVVDARQLNEVVVVGYGTQEK